MVIVEILARTTSHVKKNTTGSFYHFALTTTVFLTLSTLPLGIDIAI
jgi:hypothetical protein